MTITEKSFNLLSAHLHVAQVNDLMRGKMTNPDGSIPLYGEIFAGGCVSWFVMCIDLYAYLCHVAIVPVVY